MSPLRSAYLWNNNKKLFSACSNVCVCVFVPPFFYGVGLFWNQCYSLVLLTFQPYRMVKGWIIIKTGNHSFIGLWYRNLCITDWHFLTRATPNKLTGCVGFVELWLQTLKHVTSSTEKWIFLNIHPLWLTENFDSLNPQIQTLLLTLVDWSSRWSYHSMEVWKQHGIMLNLWQYLYSVLCQLQESFI